MPAFIQIICWSLIGSLVTGILTFASLLIYMTIFDPSDAADIRGWQTFSAMMGGLGGTLVGLVPGAIYGIIRTRKVTEHLPNDRYSAEPDAPADRPRD